MHELPVSDLRQRVFQFACRVVVFSCDLSKEPGVVRNIAWQLADAATSAGANLEEAKAPYSRRDFAAKNGIALKEMREALFWLRLIQACCLTTDQALQPLLHEAHELTAMLTAGMRRLRSITTAVAILLASFSVLSSEFLVLSSQFSAAVHAPPSA